MRPWIAALALSLALGCSEKRTAPPAPPAPATPAPAPAPDRPATSADPWIARCVQFPEGLTIVRSEDQLQRLPREGPPMNEGCPEELPATNINFDEEVLAVAYKRARCEGNIATTTIGFVWGERGSCEKLQLLKATLVVPRDKAEAVQLVKLEQ